MIQFTKETGIYFSPKEYLFFKLQGYKLLLKVTNDYGTGA